MREFWNDLTEQFRRLRVMSLCFAVILLLLGIFLGKKLRDFRDAKKASDDKASFDAENK